MTSIQTSTRTSRYGPHSIRPVVPPMTNLQELLMLIASLQLIIDEACHGDAMIHSHICELIQHIIDASYVKGRFEQHVCYEKIRGGLPTVKMGINAMVLNYVQWRMTCDEMLGL